jgi:hypothetical protein
VLEVGVAQSLPLEGRELSLPYALRAILCAYEASGRNCRDRRQKFAVGDGKQVIDDDDPDVMYRECPLRHLFRGPLAFSQSENCFFLLRLPKVEVAII